MSEYTKYTALIKLVIYQSNSNGLGFKMNVRLFYPHAISSNLRYNKVGRKWYVDDKTPLSSFSYTFKFQIPSQML